jgi:ubiquinone/menaquinone biosynthesis C-methylase UbiE
MNQDAIFQGAEANRWWQRNADVLHDQSRIDNDPVLRILLKREMKPRKVLEIGCANGWRFGELEKRYDCECVGIDPSVEALEDGKKLFPNAEFRKGMTSHLPLQAGETFDLVIVSFVLHWVDRTTLIQSVSEIDRATQEDGYLVVSDFLPDVPTKRKYHHLPKEEVYTYKQDYSKLFLATEWYEELERSTFHHATGQEEKDTPPDDRGFCSLLRKNATGLYKIGASRA